MRGHLCAIPLPHVGEIMRPLPVDALAGAAPFVRGVSLIRGEPTPVVDAAALLGGEATASPASRFVTLKAGARRVSLAVDGVLGVRSLPPASLADLPPLLAHAGGDVVSALGALDTELLFVLRDARVVPEATWSVMDAQERGA